MDTTIPPIPANIATDLVEGKGSEFYVAKGRKQRRLGKFVTKSRIDTGVATRAEAEVDLIVSMYFQGYSLGKIGHLLGRPQEYVSRVFHSPHGQMLSRGYKKEKDELASELNTRIQRGALEALDEIISLAKNGTTEGVRSTNSQFLVEKAMPKQAAVAAMQVNIGDDAIALALRTLKERDVTPKE